VLVKIGLQEITLQPYFFLINMEWIDIATTGGGVHWGQLMANFQCRPKVSAVVDEQGQTPERRPFDCDISVLGLWIICVTF